MASVPGLHRLSKRSSVVLRCLATKIPATIASTLFLPSSIQASYYFRLLFATVSALLRSGIPAHADVALFPAFCPSGGVLRGRSTFSTSPLSVSFRHRSSRELRGTRADHRGHRQ